VLAHFDPTFTREDFVEVILNNSWPESAIGGALPCGHG
jgi:hypothetical protein